MKKIHIGLLSIFATILLALSGCGEDDTNGLLVDSQEEKEVAIEEKEEVLSEIPDNILEDFLAKNYNKYEIIEHNLDIEKKEDNVLVEVSNSTATRSIGGSIILHCLYYDEEWEIESIVKQDDYSEQWDLIGMWDGEDISVTAGYKNRYKVLIYDVESDIICADYIIWKVDTWNGKEEFICWEHVDSEIYVNDGVEYFELTYPVGYSGTRTETIHVYIKDEGLTMSYGNASEDEYFLRSPLEGAYEYIIDDAGVLSSNDLNKLEEMAREAFESTGREILIYLTNERTPYAEQLAKEIYEEYASYVNGAICLIFPDSKVSNLYLQGEFKNEITQDNLSVFENSVQMALENEGIYEACSEYIKTIEGLE